MEAVNLDANNVPYTYDPAIWCERFRDDFGTGFHYQGILSFFSPFEEEEVVEAEDACMLPGGKSKLSGELESAWVDFKSMLQLIHWKSQVSICFFCAFSLAIFSTS